MNEQLILKKLAAKPHHFSTEYYAFYSSWLGGIVKDPHMMLLPIDDHLVHRGDGVFEAIKAVSRSVYLMDEHLQRLYKSAEQISLHPALDLPQLRELILETLRVADKDDACIRIFLSRGPGDFTTNPYDAVESQIYIMITKLKPPQEEKYTQGVTIGKSSIPVKSAWMAQTKTCNYLPNVLMKKEAVDRNFDYMIGTDPYGYLTESSTENLLIVDEHETIIHPPLEYILKGTIMTRACELARANGMATEIRSISVEDLQSAREAMITGTTLNILPAVSYENHPIGNGKPGFIAKRLQALILDDIKQGIRSIGY